MGADVRALHVFNVGDTAPDDLLGAVGGGGHLAVVGALGANDLIGVVEHVVDDPRGILEDDVVVVAAQLGGGLSGAGGEGGQRQR